MPNRPCKSKPSRNMTNSKKTEQQKPSSRHWKTCPSCGVKLWKWLDENRVKILGCNGQDYEIGYAYIKVVCSKCGRDTCTMSDLVDQIGEAYFEMSRPITAMRLAQRETSPYFTLSNYERRRVLKELSGLEKQILQHLTDALLRPTMTRSCASTRTNSTI